MSHHLTRWRVRSLAAVISLSLLASAAPAAAAADEPMSKRRLERAERLLEQGKYPEALALYVEADRRQSGRSPAAALGISRASLELGRYEDALAAAERAVELAGTPAERGDAHFHFGSVLLWGVQHRGLPQPERAETGPILRAIGAFR